MVCTNFTDEEVSCPLLDEWKDGEGWIRNYEDGREGNILRPYEAVIIGAAVNIMKAGYFPSDGATEEYNRDISYL